MHFDNKIQSCNSLSGFEKKACFSEFLSFNSSLGIQQKQERFSPYPFPVHTWEQKISYRYLSLCFKLSEYWKEITPDKLNYENFRTRA